MFNFFRGKSIQPEALWAYRSRLPETLAVKVASSVDGGFTAEVENVPGCFTQGDTFEGLARMVNYAVYDYYKIPEEYFPYLHSFMPPPELIEDMQKKGEKIPVGLELTFKAA